MWTVAYHAGQSKKDVLMTLLSNAGGWFPACTGMNHSAVCLLYKSPIKRAALYACFSVLNVQWLVCMACLFPFALIVVFGVCTCLCLEINWIVWSDCNPSVTVISLYFKCHLRYCGSVLSDVIIYRDCWQGVTFWLLEDCGWMYNFLVALSGLMSSCL